MMNWTGPALIAVVVILHLLIGALITIGLEGGDPQRKLSRSSACQLALVALFWPVIGIGVVTIIIVAWSAEGLAKLPSWCWNPLVWYGTRLNRRAWRIRYGREKSDG